MAEEGHLVAPLIIVPSLSAAVSVPVPAVGSFLLQIIIDIGSLYHLRKVEGHTVQHDSGLSVYINVFMAGPRHYRSSRHQLSEHESK